ncbi:MAG: endonuclease/exonuclease/phosphatase family protein, partial [Planctomycetota bacterium]
MSRLLTASWFWTACLCLVSCAAQPEPASLRVMSFNLWHGGDAGGKPVQASADVIRAAGADLVGLQEVEGRAASQGGPRPDRSVELARQLGFHHKRLAGRNAVLSRWPIAEVAPGRWGVLVETPAGTVAL